MHLEKILRKHQFDLSLLSLPEYQRGGREHLIYLLRVPATQALTQWERLRNLVSETRYWPIIGWDHFKSPPREDDIVQDIIEEGLRVDIQRWLEQEDSPTLINDAIEARHAKDDFFPFVFRLHLGRFPYTLPPLVPIALIPTSDFWEVPAYLPFYTNEWDPPLAIHIAIMKYWNEQWGAELVAVAGGGGTIEMRVLRPPNTLSKCMVLAKEQYIYCPDLIDQLM